MSLTLPDGTLATEEFIERKLKEQKLEYDKTIEELKKFISSLAIVKPVPDPDPPKPEEPKPEEPKPDLPDKCKAGPELKSVQVISPRLLLVRFHGDDVRRVEVSVPNSKGKNIVNYVVDTKFNNKMDGVVFNPDSAEQRIYLSEDLPIGKNSITYKALLCTGSSTFQFEVF